MNRLLNIRNEKGASSILVIIMMVVLLVFGLAILTTSLSNSRLGERKKNWLSEYYQLEGIAATVIAGYDHLLVEAETEALAYIDRGDYESEYDLPPTLDAESKQRLLALVYSQLAFDKITYAIAGNEDATLYLYEVDPFDILDGKALPTARLDFTVELPQSSYDKHLQISLEISPVTMDNLNQKGHIAERYIITRHTQQQEAFQLDESIDFGDPFEEDDAGGNPFDE